MKIIDKIRGVQIEVDMNNINHTDLLKAIEKLEQDTLIFSPWRNDTLRHANILARRCGFKARTPEGDTVLALALLVK